MQTKEQEKIYNNLLELFQLISEFVEEVVVANLGDQQLSQKLETIDQFIANVTTSLDIISDKYTTLLEKEEISSQSKKAIEQAIINILQSIERLQSMMIIEGSDEEE
jgi:inorganic pyrophosphatase